MQWTIIICDECLSECDAIDAMMRVFTVIVHYVYIFVFTFILFFFMTFDHKNAIKCDIFTIRIQSIVWLPFDRFFTQ